MAYNLTIPDVAGKNQSNLEGILSEPVAEDKRNLFRKATDLYFMPKSFEKSGKLYEALGVKHFKKLCIAPIINMARKILDQDRVDIPNNYLIWDFSEDGLRKFDYATRLNELVHMPAAIICAHSVIKQLSEGDYNGAAFTGFISLINAYAAMTQRYNRARIYNTVEKMQKKK